MRSTVRFGSAAAGETLPPAGRERSTLVAFAQVLIPSSFTLKGTSSADEAATVITAILDEHATDIEFQAAAAFLDGKSVATYQRPFAELDVARRREVVDHLLKPYTTRTLLSTAYYYLTEDGRRIRRVWSSVATGIIYGFYTSALGWQVVGYPRRPGECSNLIDYQEPVSAS